MNPATIAHLKHAAVPALFAVLVSWPQPATAGPAIYYLHNDHLGTPRVVTDHLRDIKWRADYKPFGETIFHVDEIEMPLRMPGQYYDSESGLHYNYFRDYDPTLGRYIQADPIGVLGNSTGSSPFSLALENTPNHLFTYVDGSPLNDVDPFGLHGQMSRFKGRQMHDGTQRGNVVGTAQLGLLVLSASERGGFEVGASAIPGFNISIVACSTPPKPSQPCDPTSPEPVISGIAGAAIVAGGVGGMPCVGIGIGTPRVSLTATAAVR